MHSLTICFGPQATTWVLMFKTAERAALAVDTLDEFTESVVSITDDFGQRVTLNAGEVSAYMLEDMTLSAEAQVLRGVHQARTQALANKQALQDPEIKASLRAQQQGPAVHTPFGLNG